MFTNSDSFYYSLTYDITNSAQRQSVNVKDKEGSPPWSRVDDRFFWNKYMIRDLLEGKNAMAKQWIIPIIQGFVQMEEIHIRLSKYLHEETPLSDLKVPENLLASSDSKFLLVLISRRSRYRGGMRYKRRGVDSDGNVANYVETEQLIYSGDNIMSFVQIRGSIPVFWSQQGYRYKPRPKLHKSDQENKLAFKAHFEEQFRIYNKEVIINLVDHTGQEKLIGDAYLRQVEMLNDRRIIYVSFDFHQQCQGRKFENVEILIEGIRNIINDLKWFWLTKDRMVIEQEGVARVNCMDSLDRTNLVQAAIARKILEQQSEFTRTGESNLSAMMKDSYRSANRYYLHHFRHAYRQAVIDLMHGVQRTKDLQALIGKEKPAKALLKKERRRLLKKEMETLIQACSSLLIPSSEEFLGGWLFVDCGPRLKDASIQDLDVMLLLSNHACYFAHIDQDSEVSHYRRISLEKIDKIVIGRQPITVSRSKAFYMRLHYTRAGKSDNYYTLKAAIQTQQDTSKETLRSIAETVQMAKKNATGVDLPVRVEHQHRFRIVEGLWALLVSCTHFLMAVINSIVKACQQGVLKNRKVNMSYRDLIEASSNIQGMPERLPASLSPDQVNPTSGLVESSESEVLYEADQEMVKDHVFSIYLPKDGIQVLQDSVSPSTLKSEAVSNEVWHFIPSSSSCSSPSSDGDDHFISSRSTSSSSFISDCDLTVMERLQMTRVRLNDAEFKNTRSNQPQHPLLLAGFSERDALPSVRGLGLHVSGKYSNNLQNQSMTCQAAEQSLPGETACSSCVYSPKVGKASQTKSPGKPARNRVPAFPKALPAQQSLLHGSRRVVSPKVQGNIQALPTRQQQVRRQSEEMEEPRESPGSSTMS
ncbi:phosphatidylinositide phosphatase SAC2-like isoform X2 [Heterodontus francisci]|uniref:phosphatidylinositide phosphatase SAC2-like isoform X2 n=1 Tax=Heterodontus francisci TaxID=7792 RepID=UPI00355C8533